MFIYILRRLPQTILVIFGVTLVTFIALQIGGDPTYLFISDRASPEEIEATRIKLGFDKPLHIQYLTYLVNLIQFDFGDSLYFRQPAMKVIFETLPATLELTIFSMLIAIFGSIPLIMENTLPNIKQESNFTNHTLKSFSILQLTLNYYLY